LAPYGHYLDWFVVDYLASFIVDGLYSYEFIAFLYFLCENYLAVTGIRWGNSSALDRVNDLPVSKVE
jgi:hypothetical protein